MERQAWLRAREDLSKYPPSLTRSWLEIEIKTRGSNKQAIIRALNSATGASTGKGRLYEWLTCTHYPEGKIREQMLRVVLPVRLEQLLDIKVDAKTLNTLLLELA